MLNESLLLGQLSISKPFAILNMADSEKERKIFSEINSTAVT